MNQPLFRKESLRRISSPEQLGAYLRVPGAGGWALLAAIVLLLAGAVVWAVWGRLEVSSPGAGSCQNGTITCLVSAETAGQLTDQSRLVVEEREYSFAVDSQPVLVSDETNGYLLKAAGLQPGQWAYALQAQVPLEDGIYDVQLLVDRFRPLSLLWN